MKGAKSASKRIERCDRKALRTFLSGIGRVAVVGLGNEYRGDDAAGIAFARMLKERVKMGGKLVVIEAGMNLVATLKEIEECRPSRVLIVDAADLRIIDGWRIISESEIVERGISTHENNVAMCVRYLNAVLPKLDIMFVDIQFHDLEVTESLELSPKVSDSIRDLADLVSESVARSGPSDLEIMG